MKKHLVRTFKFGFTAIAVGSLLSGCALFSSKDDAPAAAEGFHGLAATTAGSMPLPVEVAHDISRIYNGEDTAEEIDPGPPAVDDYDRVVNGSRKVASVKDADDASDEDADSSNKSSKNSKKHGRSKSTSHHHYPVPPPGKLKGDGKEDYVVKDGDTLMKISFEKYGNVYRWREIYDANKSKIGNFNKLEAGTVLNIHGVEYVVVEHNGKAYLIRRNDTLTKISNKVYGTPKEWRALWENNRQLIHDPNKIYAGFTMYYQPKDSLVEPRRPASSGAAKSASVKTGAGKSVAQTLPAKLRKPASAKAVASAAAPPAEPPPVPGAISDDPGQLPTDTTTTQPALPSRLPKSP